MRKLIVTTGLLMACATHAQEPAPMVDPGTTTQRAPELRIWQRSTPAPVDDLKAIPNEYAPTNSPEPLRIEFTRGLSPVQATNPPIVTPEPIEPLFLEVQPKPAEPLFIEPTQAITPASNPEPLFLEPTATPNEAITPIENDEPLFLTDSELPPELDPFFIPEPNWDELEIGRASCRERV